MRLAIGCDIAGFLLKETIKKHLEGKGLQLDDFGVAAGEDIDYPIIAQKLAESVAGGEYQRAILICGTGIGMAIVANKVPGVRAAVCHDAYSAERARKSNNAQVLAMGARVIGEELAKTIVDIWLVSEFEGGRSMQKTMEVDMIDYQYRSQK